MALPSKPIAKIFTVSKNEYDLIEDFINYYGRIFGYENVIIIDNGSDNLTTLDVYQRYIPKGVTVRVQLGYQGSSQGDHFTNVMSEYKDQAEFLIGLDTDCFFCVRGTCDKNLIISYLQQLPKNCDIFFMNHFFMSVVDVTSANYKDHKLIRPTDCTSFILRDNYEGSKVPHVFFRASNFVSTENGNHNGVTTTNSQHYCYDVCYIHFHETGRQRHMERCRTIVLGYDCISENLTKEEELDMLRKNWNGRGLHRQRQYLEYLENPTAFFEEKPMPADTFEFTQLKRFLQ